MARPTPLSGFPELLPGQRFVEQQVVDTLRRTFELHGFAGIETRAVEPLDQLLRKGETSKEIYDRLVDMFKVSNANQILFLKNRLKDIKKGKDKDI